jgi:alpha-amylase/alpha-mannosidase (GH57 family)
MHQPFYLDRMTGEISMPWVRLHATKGYYDMISLLEDFPKIKATFNLVPSLITQLFAYLSGSAKDLHYEYTLIPAEELTLEQRKFVLREFFQANWETMIRPNRRYWELINERGLHLPPGQLDDQTVAKFNTQAFRDIQVWFNLAWFGYRSREKYPAIAELMHKGGYFSEDDKREVLSIQMQVIRDLIPLYRRMQDEGRVELTTSPFYHPILPLLCDSEFAWRSMPGAKLPGRFKHPEDAQEQINKAVAYHAEIFQRPPKGMWPSEGSVCPEIIPMMSQAGIKWIATDEAILGQTLHASNIYDHLYRPYRAKFQGSEVNIIFRDRVLSDLISFGYSRNKPEEASSDLLHRLHRIAENHGRFGNQTLVSVILDGENAWEYYPCGGRDFLKRVYERLSVDQSLRTVTVSEFLEQNPPKYVLENLYSGSWIGHNFDIWIGEYEENSAWDCLKRTRTFLNKEDKNHKANPNLSQAWDSLYAAEGSDWFWWYGPDFSTDNDAEFDRLFRVHLQNVYKALNEEVPHDLSIPLLIERKPPVGHPPVSLIKPRINGRITDFFEWKGAGYYECARGDKAIALGCRYITHIYYGFDLDTLYLRFDLDLSSGIRPEDAAIQVHVCFNSGPVQRLVLPLYLDLAEKKKFSLERSSDGMKFTRTKEYTTIAWSKVLELSIPFSDLGFRAKQEIEFFTSLKNNKIEIMRLPRESTFKFKVPHEGFESEMWMV